VRASSVHPYELFQVQLCHCPLLLSAVDAVAGEKLLGLASYYKLSSSHDLNPKLGIIQDHSKEKILYRQFTETVSRDFPLVKIGKSSDTK
jgi:hypothetical protein